MRNKSLTGLFSIFGLIGLALVLSGAKPLEMTPDKSAARPLADWSWMGSAVTEEDITWNLENFKDVGIGGVAILPIYGVKGEGDRQISFLSPEWVHMLKFTADEAKRLGLSLDMSEGTGWPYGGPNVPKEDVAWKTVLYKEDLDRKSVV